MAPRLKEHGSAQDVSDSSNLETEVEFNLLKALLHFSLNQVTGDQKDLDIRDFLRRRSKDSSKDLLIPKICPSTSHPSLIQHPHPLPSQHVDTLCKDTVHLQVEKPHHHKRWMRPSLGRGSFCRRRRGSKDDDKSPKDEKREVKFPPVEKVSDQKAADNNSSSRPFSMQQHLALTALDLTVPICNATVLQHRQFVQLAGHPGSLAPAGPGTIWKKQPGTTNEAWVYEALMNDVAKDVVPKFYREIEYEGERFVEMSDLLSGFTNPSLMDIKMGTRTFLESEAANSKPRKDLYKKMINVDPDAPTAAEHESESITKLRYMDFRDNMSSTKELGFRIDALKMSGNCSVTELKKLKERSEIVDTLSQFTHQRESTKKQIVRQLIKIRERFEESKFLKDHEIIGSSILIVYDDNKANAWMIDFAKTFTLPEGVVVNHRDDWCVGNHEEGYLKGLDNLIALYQQIPAIKSRKLSIEKFFRRL